MRLWSIHPKYLDAKGLVALWREALLAQKVLAGETKGYKNHPQLIRFLNLQDPWAPIGSYLEPVLHEAILRGYQFNAAKINSYRFNGKIKVNRGQLAYEFSHLRKKLEKRNPDKLKQIQITKFPEPHPLFIVIDGDVENWEVIID